MDVIALICGMYCAFFTFVCAIYMDSIFIENYPIQSRLLIIANFLFSIGLATYLIMSI